MKHALQEKTLVKPFGEPPRPGTFKRVGEGVLWLHLAGAGAPLGGVNVYAIEDDDGWAIVDTGFSGPETQSVWRSILGTVLPGQVTRIIATHYHPDHIGQVGYLQGRFDAPLLMTRAEWQHARQMVARREQRQQTAYFDYLRGQGMGSKALAEVQARMARSAGGLGVALPEGVTEISANEVLDIGRTKWRVQTGGGHSPEAMVLINDAQGLVIVGDQILPGITPHVGVQSDAPFDDPLGDYLNFLDRARLWGAGLVALPGHGPVFNGPGQRATEIADHHYDRLNHLRKHVDADVSSADLVEVLFGRPLSGFHLLLGLTETHAHLNHLVGLGEIERLEGMDGVTRFARTGRRAALN